VLLFIFRCKILLGIHVLKNKTFYQSMTLVVVAVSWKSVVLKVILWLGILESSDY